MQDVLRMKDSEIELLRAELLRQGAPLSAGPPMALETKEVAWARSLDVFLTKTDGTHINEAFPIWILTSPWFLRRRRPH